MDLGLSVNNWLRHTSREYDREAKKWEYVADHLTGEVIDDDKIKKYLHRRKQGETSEAYQERTNLVDYTPHFARAALTLAGMLWAVDYDARRRWAKIEGGEGMGNPETDGTPMARLWENADGRGSNWPTVWHGATIDAIAYRKFYVLVDGVRRNETGDVIAEPSIRILPPQCVPDASHDDAGRPVWYKVKTSTEIPRTPREPAKEENRYLIFDVEGIETWRETENGLAEQIGKRFYGGPDNPGFRYLDRDMRTPILPIFEVSIPLRAHLGYIMAKKANAIFNQENSNDFLHWISSFPKLMADVRSADGTFDKKQWDQITKSLKEGANVLPGKDNKYDAPPTGPAEIKEKYLKRKVDAFFTTFFQAYGDAASERTATEIRQDFRAGVEAFLILLGTTMDEAENGALWRLEQVSFPGRMDLWGGAFVERSTNFQPVDINQRLESLVGRYMPNGRVPLDEETAHEIQVKALESDGIAIGEDRKKKLRAALKVEMDRAASVPDPAQKPMDEPERIAA